MAARTGHAKRDARREAAVLTAIHAFRRTLTAFQRHLGAAAGGDISMADAFALHYLAHAGDATPGAIAAFTGLTSGSVSTMLDRMEKAGYVARRKGAADRRQVIVQLVPGARQKLMASMVEAHHAVGRMFDGWGTADIEALVALLERLEPGNATA